MAIFKIRMILMQYYLLTLLNLIESKLLRHSNEEFQKHKNLSNLIEESIKNFVKIQKKHFL